MIERFWRKSISPFRAVPPSPQHRPLEARVRQLGTIPVCWAAATATQCYLNLGDALSAVMVSAVSGQGVTHASAAGSAPRLSAVGTIGHSLRGGEIWIWGTGSSAYANPLAVREERVAYVAPPETTLHVHATRGPLSWQILTGRVPDAASVYGDPVWLLPLFYRPQVEKRWELGVVLHLSELADRAFEAHPISTHIRYKIPEAQSDRVRLLNTITPISAEGLRARVDDILACKRIVSTSLHGLIIAEAYGIPCLYFPPRPGTPGVAETTLTFEDGLNLRVSDFYSGLGEKRLSFYRQPRNRPTDWDAVIKAVDSVWRPRALDERRLLAAFPLVAEPVETDNIFSHARTQELPFQHHRPVAAIEARK
jgi:pyruvyltransferase